MKHELKGVGIIGLVRLLPAIFAEKVDDLINDFLHVEDAALNFLDEAVLIGFNEVVDLCEQQLARILDDFLEE
ncbi:MAG TPA: hypothetical protein VIS99_16120 [Terrimicrobiaceae bacterium]